MKKNRKKIGPVMVLILITLGISILSLILSLIGVKTNMASISNGAVELSLVSINNIFSKGGISYILGNTITNFRILEPIILFIISLTITSIFESSGLINHISQSLKKINPVILTFLVILLGNVFTLFGDYSFVLLLPLIGVIYKSLGKNPLYGILAVFIGITTGYGTGLIYDYNYYEMGQITEQAASIEVDKSYTFNLVSNFYIMLVSTIVIAIVTTIIYVRKFKKLNYKYIEEKEYKTSDKGLFLVSIISLIFIIITIYGIIPGILNSGFLLDKTQTNYVAKLFSDSAPFKEGLLIIILIASLICGLVYGKKSGNIKQLTDFDNSLFVEFKEMGYMFVLLFFSTILIEIVDWTNLSTFIVSSLTLGLSNIQFSGMLLIIIFFITVFIMSFFIPNTLIKWNMISPLLVPLFMKSNITPEFTQFVFGIADGLGKTVSPLFVYFIILIAFINKYNNPDKVKLSEIIKKLISIIFLIAGVWLLLIIVWYIIGLPLGIGTSIIM